MKNNIIQDIIKIYVNKIKVINKIKNVNKFKDNNSFLIFY